MIDLNVSNYKYPSRRNVVCSNNGMVATSQPIAAQIGIDTLHRGGNAIDAAVSMATALTVVEPTSNGIGGDAFAIVYYKNKLYGLNASGPAGSLSSASSLRNQGLTNMPIYGAVPVTVPGAPAAWSTLVNRFGNLSLSEVMKESVRIAEEGYAVSPTTAENWNNAYSKFKLIFSDEMFKYWFKTFCPNGKAPKAGELWSSKAHADTLAQIGLDNSKSFYKGFIAEKIISFIKKCGGTITLEDLGNYQPEWVDPVSINYKGFDVWEMPPNGQGIVTLMALNMLKTTDFDERDSAFTYHNQIEAIKIAFADSYRFLSDQISMEVSLETLLSDAYANQRKKLILPEKASIQTHGKPQYGGTVYLCTADSEGNMVSFIQSNYMGFGSGLVVPDTGIALHNRGNNFSLEPEHPNVFSAGKKPYHTIMPGFITCRGEPVGPFGVMGGFMQPQGHLQIVMNTIDFLLNPQEALDAPRWQWIQGNTVFLEKSNSSYLINKLLAYGHDIKIKNDFQSFGRGQIIWKNKDGVYLGGTEPRADGNVLASIF